MSLFEVAVIVGLAAIVILSALCLLKISRLQPPQSWGEKLESIDIRLNDNLSIVQLGLQGMRTESAQTAKELRAEIGSRFNELGLASQETLRNLGSQLSERFNGFGQQLTDHRNASSEDAKLLRTEVNKSLAELGRTVEGRLDRIRTENNEKLERIRQTVDEQLQGTLEKRLGASFNQVNESLKRVFESVGEMQALATGVGDLKRILSNVKLRGSLFEGSLEQMLDDVLTRDQFSKNVEVRPLSGERVEFALKMPTPGDDPVWLAIDSKMPKEDYDRLTQASVQGDAAAVELSAKALERCVFKHAKDISEKYICVPHSLDVAVMFLPTEGLFAEVVRRPGLVDRLQRELHIMVTGPTTLHALLSAIRVGYRSQAIQERSTEIWKVLGAVKTEFSNFGVVLDKVHKKLGEAQSAVEAANVRKRAVAKTLREVEALPNDAAKDVLALTSMENDELTDYRDETASIAAE